MVVTNLLNLESVSKSFDIRALLDGVSLGVNASDRIGIVGRNGGGKSTLIKVMAGIEAPDSGRVSKAGSINIGLLGQSDDSDEDSLVRDVVLGDLATHEWAGNSKVREVLTGLFGGISEELLDRKISYLSGGERRRVNLAKLLIADLDLVLLDEPTNHLDVEGISWLAQYLKRNTKLAVVVITHDRWFLDEVSDQIWEVVDGNVLAYDGGYSAYVLSKAERARQITVEDGKRNALIRKELAWLRRGAPAQTVKPKFRIDAANTLIANEPPPRNETELLNFAANRLGNTVFEIHQATIKAGEKIILEDLYWNIGPGDRIGVVGVNGAGKTTLFRALLGQISSTAGKITTGVTVKAAFLSQHLEELDPTWRVLEAVEKVANQVQLGNGKELSASQLCEKLGFNTDSQWTPVGDLSGGERRRLQLTRLLMDSPNVLLLDEPTNDFDVETLTALEDLLDSFGGTLLVISHDRYFLERVCDRFVGLLGDSKLRDLPRGIDEYLKLRSSSIETSGSVTTKVKTSNIAEIKEVRKEIAKYERQIAKLEAQIIELESQQSELAFDHEKLGQNMEELAKLSQEKSAIEESWLQANTNLEGLEN
ncbi:MAG: ABC-F family ATP-binding cassette domain-containing protein [Actinobacteria bacterium]|jgi:ABC transport system ATP-binding/permease protein|nr:ABC-F family ATP-binding cassette domain-containing protein [Actinomycetota bacterium]MDA2981449.1 ABC-F family ATP-binding cassette domain-containing protein [Actinomycetota bacterium]MDA2996276.1 ABC-F family ATP-binding cassette domain-containing protein [Actinomycetota bacterium]